MSCLIPSAMQRNCQDLIEPYQLAPILQLTDKTLIFFEGHRAKARGLTGRTLFGIEEVSRSSSVRVSSLPLYASCIRQPRPHASTAQGGPCCTACQSAFPTCTKTSSQHRLKERQEDCSRYQKPLKGSLACWHELRPVALQEVAPQVCSKQSSSHSPYLCRLVLCANHPRGSHEWPLSPCGWLMLTEQVKPMQPPVQRLRHDNGAHADVSMDLQATVPVWSFPLVLHQDCIRVSCTSGCEVPGICYLFAYRDESEGPYLLAVIVKEAHSLCDMKESHCNVFFSAAAQ